MSATRRLQWPLRFHLERLWDGGWRVSLDVVPLVRTLVAPDVRATTCDGSTFRASRGSPTVGAIVGSSTSGPASFDRHYRRRRGIPPRIFKTLDTGERVEVVDVDALSPAQRAEYFSRVERPDPPDGAA